MWDSIVGLVSSAAAGSNGALQLAGTFLEVVTNYRMWRSLGWLLLGIVLAGAGLAIWNRKGIAAAGKLAATAAVL